MYRNHRETRPLFGEAEIRTRDGRSREGTLTTAPPFYIDHRTVRLVVKRRAPFHRTRDRHVIGEHMLQGVQTEAMRSPVGMLKLNPSRSLTFCIFSFFLKNHASLRSRCCCHFCCKFRRIIALKLVKKSPKLEPLMRIIIDNLKNSLREVVKKALWL